MQNSQVGHGGESVSSDYIPRIFEEGKIYDLEQVIELSAYELYESARLLGILSEILKLPEQQATTLPGPADEGIVDAILPHLNNAETLYYALAFEPALKQVRRIKKRLSEGDMGHDELSHMIHDLQFWAKDGSRSNRFFHMTEKNANLYHDPFPFGENVSIALPPDCSFDIEEAAKSFACGRPTACVLHLMRTVDTTLNIVGAPLGITTQNNPSWHSFLGKIPKALNAHYGTTDEGWQHKTPFYRDMLPYLYAMKNAWRNQAFHASSKYTEGEALEIFEAVKAFAARLASNMPITL